MSEIIDLPFSGKKSDEGEKRNKVRMANIMLMFPDDGNINTPNCVLQTFVWPPVLEGEQSAAGILIPRMLRSVGVVPPEEEIVQ